MMWPFRKKRKGIRQQMKDAGPREDGRIPEGLKEAFDQLARQSENKTENPPTHFGVIYGCTEDGDVGLMYVTARALLTDTEERAKRKGPLIWYRYPGAFWFRLFGYGLCMKREEKPYSVFKGRDRKSVRMGKWYLAFLG